MPEYAYFWFYLLLFAFLLQNTFFLFRRWRGRSRGRNAAQNAALVFFSLFALFLAGEGYLYFDYDTSDGAMIFLTSMRWLDRHSIPNEMSYRGRWPKYDAADKSRLRICVLGDSVAWGQGINREEDRLSELLEKELDKAGIKADVYNVSKPGWSTGNEVMALEKFKGSVKFDLVILLYVPNDHVGDKDLPKAYQDVKSTAWTPPCALLNKSLLLDHLYKRLVLMPRLAIYRYDRMMLEKYEDEEILKQHTAWLARLRRYCSEEGIGLAVATFPMTLVPWDRYILAELHRELDNYWREAGVPHLDLLPGLSRYPVEKLTVGRYENHPNELANRLAAEMIYRRFFEELKVQDRIPVPSAPPGPT